MSVIAPLSGITILLNSLLASFFLGERIRIIEIFATMVIFTGATFTCVYGAHDVPPHTVDELFELFGQESFTIFLSVLASLVTVCLLGLRASGGTSMEDTLAPFLYATIAASLGGLELILLKAVMEVLHTALLGGKIEQLEDGGSYTLFAIFALVAMAQVNFSFRPPLVSPSLFMACVPTSDSQCCGVVVVCHQPSAGAVRRCARATSVSVAVHRGSSDRWRRIL